MLAVRLYSSASQPPLLPLATVFRGPLKWNEAHAACSIHYYLDLHDLMKKDIPTGAAHDTF